MANEDTSSNASSSGSSSESLLDMVRARRAKAKADVQKLRNDVRAAVDEFTADKPRLLEMVRRARERSAQAGANIRGRVHNVQNALQNANQMVQQAQQQLGQLPPLPPVIPNVPIGVPPENAYLYQPNPLIVGLRTPAELAQMLINAGLSQELINQLLANYGPRLQTAANTAVNLQQQAQQQLGQLPTMNIQPVGGFLPQGQGQPQNPLATGLGNAALPPSLQRALRAASGQREWGA